MAKFEMDGLSTLSAAFEQLAALPDDVMFEMLEAGGDVVVKAQQAKADAFGLRDTGLMIESIRAGKPRRLRDGGEIALTPEGTRRRGKTVTRNAEIAYVNEYGKGGQPGTEFIKLANAESEGRARQAAGNIYNKWLDRIGL